MEHNDLLAHTRKQLFKHQRELDSELETMINGHGFLNAQREEERQMRSTHEFVPHNLIA